MDDPESGVGRAELTQRSGTVAGRPLLSGDTGWADLTDTLDANSTVTRKSTGWTNVPSGVKTDVLLRVLGYNGHGANPLAVAQLTMSVRP